MPGTTQKRLFPYIMILVPWTAKVISQFEASSDRKRMQTRK